jgi:hypothetical protein
MSRADGPAASIEDPVLGRLVWERVYERWCWTFPVSLDDGLTVRAYALPHPDWDPLSDEHLPRIRALVVWLRENAASLRARVVAEMFDEWRLDYWNSEADGDPTPEFLAGRLRLMEITLVPNGLAYLEYHFDSVFGPGAIRLGITSTGEVVIKPQYP